MEVISGYILDAEANGLSTRDLPSDFLIRVNRAILEYELPQYDGIARNS